MQELDNIAFGIDILAHYNVKKLSRLSNRDIACIRDIYQMHTDHQCQ